MKTYLFCFCLLVLVSLFPGCIISEYPDTKEPIVLKPGETQQFKVTATNLPYYRSAKPVKYQWNPDKVTPTALLPNNAGFTPATEDIGVTQVNCHVSISSQSGETLFTGDRTWEVQVWGIKAEPDKESVSINPGETQPFEILKVYPEGQISYAWSVNGEERIGETNLHFDFTADQPGKYIVAVTVTSDSLSESQSWIVYVGLTQWPTWGGNLNNTHYVERETKVGPNNVSQLKPKWIFQTNGSISAIPTSVDHLLYFPDWGKVGIPYIPGKMYALNRETGEVVWSRFITSYNGGDKANNVSRSSPAIYKDTIIFGDVVNPLTILLGNKPQGPRLYCVNRFNGKLIWSKKVDDHPVAQVTQSPVVADGVVYVGVSSYENVFVGLGVGEIRFPAECCNFRGNMMAFNADTGELLWKTYTTPDNGGALDQFSGVSIWGSSPVIDKARNRLYVGTGQNYKVPAAYTNCLKDAEAITDAGERDDAVRLCHQTHNPPDNYQDSVLAMDLTTGEIEWAFKTLDYDAWTLACGGVIGLLPILPAYPPECPDPQGPDYDFPQAPMLFKTQGGQELLGIGQKTGVFWALDPDTGELVWSTVVGPGGKVGGHMFGAATDGKRIFVQTTNLDHHIVLLKDGITVTNGGYWSALSAETGDILWQTPDPSASLPITGGIFHPYMGAGLGPGFFAAPQGPLTLANGVVYAGSMDMEGHMYAMDAETGEILWSYASGGSVNTAPTVINGVLYWGSGYRNGFDNDKFYSFSVPESE